MHYITTQSKLRAGEVPSHANRDNSTQLIPTVNVRPLYDATAIEIGNKKSPVAKERLEKYQPRGSKKNKLAVRRAISLFLAYLSENEKPGILLTEIKKDTCVKFLGEQLRDKGLATASVAYYKGQLSRVFQSVIEKETLNIVNPFSLLNMRDIKQEFVPERKGCDRVTRRPFTMAEMRIILNKFPAPYNDLAAVSYFTCGLGIGDCIFMQWSQIDFEEGTISFTSQKIEEIHVLPLLPELRRRLENLRRQSHAMESPYVFPKLIRDARRHKGTVSTHFSAYLDAFGIKRNVAHSDAPGKRRKVSGACFHSVHHTAVLTLRSGGIAAAVFRALVSRAFETTERGKPTISLAQKREAMSVLVQALEDTGSQPEK